MATLSKELLALLDEREVARITGMSVATVRRWRLLRRGPDFLKFGNAVRYDPRDVATWLESTRRISTLEAR